jgi:CheY-like chemotaxis protein
MDSLAQGSKRILVVEDDTLARTALAAILQTAGCAVTGAADGREALELLHHEERPPDLIVLDLFMPGMDGWHFRRAQQRDPALADVPVVICSGIGDAELHAQALGAAGCLNKPIEPDDLLALVRRILGPTPEEKGSSPDCRDRKGAAE